LNIVCDKTLLSAAIDGVSKAVTMRSSIPVLEGILLKAEGFQLTLTGYDLEMGIVTTIEANIKEPGEIVLNAKLLSSMISRMPAGQISIVAADNGKTTIQSGVAQFEIQSMPATDFPDLPNTGAEQTLTIKTGVLRDMIDRTLYAVSQDEKKPAHTGELFEIELDKLTIVALDGYRLAIVERPITDHRILDRNRLKGIDSFYLGDGTEVQGALANRYADRRNSTKPAFQYRAIVFNHTEGNSYRLTCTVNGTAGHAIGEFDSRSALVTTPSGSTVTAPVLLCKAAGSTTYTTYTGDWALYDGYILD
jgi:DNA polymerase-3 subunit beta